MKVTATQLIKRYKEETALDGVSFGLKNHEILCILGPSGSGKSTLLRCLAGLEELDGGTIEMDDTLVERIQPSRYSIGMVFDKPNLIQHYTVYQNIAFGLDILGYTKEEIDQKVHEVAEDVELLDYLYRKPSTLSQGQKQRVSLARALVRKCRLLLMDEALSNLDEMLKKKMIELLIQCQKKYEFSCLYVTHSRLEAKLLQCEVMILDCGKILQRDTLQNLKDFPINERVANFLED